MDRRQAEQYAAEQDDAFVMCRAHGHDMKPFTAHYEGENIIIVERCQREGKIKGCGSTVWLTMDKRGYKSRPTRGYPKGYLTQGMGRMDRDARAALYLEYVKKSYVIRPEEKDA